MTKTNHKTIPRRSFMKRMAVGGVALLPLAGTLTAGTQITSQTGCHGKITKGDVAILRFLSALEILEADLWQQYTELGNNNIRFREALTNIDLDFPDYIAQNTEDEISHANFLNAFLVSIGKPAINLEPLRTLPSSLASGAAQIKRLTNLMHLNVDTSWYLRYRSSGNPDFGDTFPQVVNIVDRTGIPLRDDYSPNQIQGIANTAAFHFAMIEQGGTSLYAALSLKVTNLVVLRILASIGGSEVMHFEVWNDHIGDVPPIDSTDGLVFPNLNVTHPEAPTNQVMPKPCKFISTSLPLCSVIRPTSLQLAGAQATVRFLTDTGLFVGQSPEFFRTMKILAKEADCAMRSPTW